MSSTVAPTLESVRTRKGTINANDSAPLIDSRGEDDAAIVHVENNGSDGLAVHQNSSENLVNSVTSDHGAGIVAGVERPSSGDVGESVVGPSNQADVASRTSMAIARYRAEIVNSERL